MEAGNNSFLGLSDAEKNNLLALAQKVTQIDSISSRPEYSGIQNLIRDLSDVSRSQQEVHKTPLKQMTLDSWIGKNKKDNVRKRVKSKDVLPESPTKCAEAPVDNSKCEVDQDPVIREFNTELFKGSNKVDISPINSLSDSFPETESINHSQSIQNSDTINRSYNLRSAQRVSGAKYSNENTNSSNKKKKLPDENNSGVNSDCSGSLQEVSQVNRTEKLICTNNFSFGENIDKITKDMGTKQETEKMRNYSLSESNISPSSETSTLNEIPHGIASNPVMVLSDNDTSLFSSHGIARRSTRIARRRLSLQSSTPNVVEKSKKNIGAENNKSLSDSATSNSDHFINFKNESELEMCTNDVKCISNKLPASVPFCEVQKTEKLEILQPDEKNSESSAEKYASNDIEICISKEENITSEPLMNVGEKNVNDLNEGLNDVQLNDNDDVYLNIDDKNEGVGLVTSPAKKSNTIFENVLHADSMEESEAFPGLYPQNVENSEMECDYQTYCDLREACKGIGVNLVDLFEKREVIDSIKAGNPDEVYIICGHMLLSGNIVPSVHKSKKSEMEKNVG